MRIAAVQIRPVAGDIEANLELHVQAIARAADAGAAWAVFPELSLTGYEPRLAVEQAMAPEDARLDRLQRAANERGLAVAVGMPLAGGRGVHIGMAVLRPEVPRTTFAKHHLHPDEEAFFVPGKGLPVLDVGGVRLAFAICYEISVPGHAARAAADGATVYVASVAKTASGVSDAIRTLAGVAERHGMAVLMVNCVGSCDGSACGGRSSAWAPGSGLRAQLGADEEGLLLLDTSSAETLVHALPA